MQGADATGEGGWTGRQVDEVQDVRWGGCQHNNKGGDSERKKEGVASLGWGGGSARFPWWILPSARQSWELLAVGVVCCGFC